MDYGMKVVQHTSKVDLLPIISLKQQCWPYSYDNQKAWIEKNTTERDRHVLLYKGNDLIGYMCLNEVTCIKDNTSILCNGVGSICVDASLRNMGWGSLILGFAKAISISERRPLVLRCHDELVVYYANHGFKEVLADNIFVCGSVDKQHFMSTGYEWGLSKQLQIDRLF